MRAVRADIGPERTSVPRTPRATVRRSHRRAGIWLSEAKHPVSTSSCSAATRLQMPQPWSPTHASMPAMSRWRHRRRHRHVRDDHGNHRVSHPHRLHRHPSALEDAKNAAVEARTPRLNVSLVWTAGSSLLRFKGATEDIATCRNGHAGQFQDAGAPHLQIVFEGCARVASHRGCSARRNSKRRLSSGHAPSFVTFVARRTHARR